MRSVEGIYLSKLYQLENIIQQKAGKCSGAQAAFADILDSVQRQIDVVSGAPAGDSMAVNTHSAVAPNLSDIYTAGLFFGYLGRPSVATRSEIDAAIEKAAQATGLDPALIRAVIRVESSFDSSAVSGAGAQGLMQLMPGTARELGVSDPFDVEQNVMGGATYLARQLRRFGDVRLALAAYNTGPGRVSSYHITDANNPGEYEKLPRGVRGYVAKVLQYYEQYKTTGGGAV
jgi:soluble lytic murein transglycosylase-like protein